MVARDVPDLRRGPRAASSRPARCSPERIVEEDLEAILEQVTRAREHGGDFDAFARIRQPDGQLRDVHFRGSMVTAPGSAGEHLHGICQDLTDVRRAEEARAEAVERFRSVFERAPVGMALVARDGRFTLANEAMGEFLGRPGDALLRAAPSATSPIPTTCAATADALRRMVGGRAARVERREALRAAERRGPLGRPAGAAPARRRGPRPALPGAHARRHRAAAGRAAALGRCTAPRGSWPAARRWARRCRRSSRPSCASSTGSAGALWLLDAARASSRREAAWPPGSAPRRTRRRCPPSPWPRRRASSSPS